MLKGQIVLDNDGTVYYDNVMDYQIEGDFLIISIPNSTIYWKVTDVKFMQFTEQDKE